MKPNGDSHGQGNVAVPPASWKSARARLYQRFEVGQAPVKVKATEAGV
jgi:hypothetical protein